MADLQDDPQSSSTAAVGELDRISRTAVPKHIKPAPVEYGSQPTPAAELTEPELAQLVVEPELADQQPAEPTAPQDSLSRARALLAAHPVADGYNRLAWTLGQRQWHDLELGESTLDTDIPRLRTGGVGAQFWSLLVPAEYAGDRAISATLEQIDLVKRVVAAYPEGFRLALTAGDMADARNCGRIASLLGPVSGHALGESLGTLRAYHALGVRSVAFAGTRWAGAKGEGLTPFGQEVVREMNRLGVLIDLTGAPREAVQGVLSVSRAPVLLSHSGARALTDTPVNASDDVLRALAPDKGVCMVGFAPEQTVRRVADHLDHVREVAGPECVGLSGMYGADVADVPHADDLRDVSCYPHLIAELLDRGWDETDIALLTWGNAARVVRDTEFTSRATRRRRPIPTAS
ncbi:dipeptidase [Streptomyces sp. ISL-100]|uniref:dipeptidase n=1 Tax=Streptomyces sp. ISL-100 TaxID=2819173 RepID=UPI001BECFAA9|nr:dipeptidase [Streptomyces sp. ISL-100]MBT2401072.1 dipeptidase [Streptomyces sp. ISL-100]